MNRRDKYIDISVLAAIGILFCQSVFQYFNYGYTFSVNTWVGLFCWLLVVLFKIVSPERSRFLVFFLLAGGVLNIISFSAKSYFVGESRLHSYNGFYYTTVSINPVIFLIFIIYAILNRSVITALWSKMIGASKDEREEESAKEEAFYYEKFLDCGEEEWKKIIKDFQEYPENARVAISKIIAERREK